MLTSIAEEVQRGVYTRAHWNDPIQEGIDKAKLLLEHPDIEDALLEKIIDVPSNAECLGLRRTLCASGPEGIKLLERIMTLNPYGRSIIYRSYREWLDRHATAWDVLEDEHIYHWKDQAETFIDYLIGDPHKTKMRTLACIKEATEMMHRVQIFPQSVEDVKKYEYYHRGVLAACYIGSHPEEATPTYLQDIFHPEIYTIIDNIYMHEVGIRFYLPTDINGKEINISYGMDNILHGFLTGLDALGPDGDKIIEEKYPTMKSLYNYMKDLIQLKHISYTPISCLSDEKKEEFEKWKANRNATI